MSASLPPAIEIVLPSGWTVVLVSEFVHTPSGMASCDFDADYGEVNCKIDGRHVTPRRYREFIGRDGPNAAVSEVARLPR